MKKSFLLILILCLAAAALGQDAPSRVQTQPAVLADLAARLGRSSISLGDLGGWKWSYGTYEFVLGSGCVGAPTSDPAASRWQRWEMPYNGTTYVYLITDNAQTIILCNAPALTTPTAPSSAQPTALAFPTASAPTPIVPLPTAQGNASSGTLGGPSTASSACMLPTRLTISEMGRVTPGDPNWLRQEPRQASSKLGEIEAGGQFQVTDGPVCDEVSGVNYWFVVGDQASGWTGEGANGTYWLEPIERTVIIDLTTASTLHSASWISESQLDVQNVIFSYGGGYFVVLTTSGRAALYNASTDELISELRSPNQQAFTRVRFSSNNSLIATADVSNSVYIWDTSNARALAQVTVDQPITAIALSQSLDPILAVATADGQVRLWGTVGLTPQTPALVSLKVEGIPDALEFSPDNRMLIARDINEKMLALWSVGE